MEKTPENYFEVLKSCMLFENIQTSDMDSMLQCLNTKVKLYKKGAVILLAHDDITEVGIVLSGTIQVIKEDYLGNKHILTKLSVSDLFAEAFACAGIKKSPVTVISVTECAILFIEFRKIITVCTSACTFHTRLVENMLKLIANKNIMLNQKIELISKRSTREKLLSYFELQMKGADDKCFTIPFKRHELADFLCVDRSAMSRELCRLRDEGILRFNGNEIEMLL